MHCIRNWVRNTLRKIFTFGNELWHFYINTQQDQHKKPTNWEFSPGFQWILTVGFFKGTEQVENNIKNTSLLLTASWSSNLNWIPHDKEHIQHHRAGTSPSQGFPFILGFTPFTPWKKRLFYFRICSFSSVYNGLIVYNRHWLLSQVCANIH